ncbi:MAG: hypothetical protein E6Q97_28095 [Desulfurellales bacterium]|nr:MAG: hypothetical protein E6Q97_28095 [Desulfurellales bacterium]
MAEAKALYPTTANTYIALETMTIVLVEAPSLSTGTAATLLEHDAVAVGKLVWFLPWMLPSLRLALLDAEKKHRADAEAVEVVKSRIESLLAPRKGVN